MTERIHIKAFGGELPKLGRRLLDPGSAQFAIDCFLGSGEIRPLKKNRLDLALPKAGFLRSVYLYNADWLQWAEDVSVAQGQVAGDDLERIYFTGTDVPRTTDLATYNTGAGTEYPTTSYMLGQPQPLLESADIGRTNAGAGDAPDATARAVAYCYRFVSARGEAGPRSAIITLDSVNDGEQIDITLETLADFSTPQPTLQGRDTRELLSDGVDGVDVARRGLESEWNIDRVEIFRTLDTATADPVFVRVASVAFQASGPHVYSDTALDADVASNPVLANEFAYPPPADMVQIHSMANGVMAGISGRDLCLSDPFLPHSWPSEYRVPISSRPVAVSSAGTLCVVLTNGKPVLIPASDPSIADPTDLPDVLPCVSARAVVQGSISGSPGVIYPTTTGLAFIGQSGSRVVTSETMDQRDWEALFPSSLHAVFHDGKYLAWYTTGDVNGVRQGGGFIIDMLDPQRRPQRISYYAHAAHVDDESNLWLVIDEEAATPSGRANNVYEWEGTGEWASFTWVSKEFGSGRPLGLSACRVLAEFNDTMTESERAQYESRRAVLISQASSEIEAAVDSLNTLSSWVNATNPVADSLITGIGYDSKSKEWVICARPTTSTQNTQLAKSKNRTSWDVGASIAGSNAERRFSSFFIVPASDPAAAHDIYWGVCNEILSVSFDGGASFSTVGGFLALGFPAGFGTIEDIQKVGSRTVVLTTESAFYTDNDGSTWAEQSSARWTALSRQLAYKPDPGIWAASAPGLIMSSTDNGVTWVQTNISAILSAAPGGNLNHAAISADDGGFIIFTPVGGTNAGQFFFSTDAVSWVHQGGIGAWGQRIYFADSVNEARSTPIRGHIHFAFKTDQTGGGDNTLKLIKTQDGSSFSDETVPHTETGDNTPHMAVTSGENILAASTNQIFAR